MSFEHSVIKLFVGSDIDSTVIADGAALATVLGAIADGEIVVLDQDKKLMYDAAVGTFTYAAGYKGIYIMQGLTKTYDYVDPAGTSHTVRAVRTSDKIDGIHVRKYVKESYLAKAEKAVDVDLTGVTFTEGLDYVIRLVYKDMVEYPGQYTASYRVTAGAAETATTMGDKFAVKVNSHKSARVTAVNAAGVVTLTGKPIPECTSSIEDIDVFTQVDFDVFTHYVDANENWQEIPGISVSVSQQVSPGSGIWEVVRDMEKSFLNGIGERNILMFPVKFGEMKTVVGGQYDLVVFTHDAPYVAPNNQGAEVMPIDTVIAFPSGSGQGTAVTAILDEWVASLPQEV